ncbi:FAD dependent oxidoreductase [Lactarius deliciosus]|nr:FAD dependent oxidoreductase [Lactarius deliciosus]
MVPKHSESIIIVGAGCFGISTAYHLLQRGYTNVTVLDRSEKLPAPDAASTDINKIVRTSYPDVFYTQLARDAIQEWNKSDEWGDCYRGCGVLVIGGADDDDAEQPYSSKAYANDVATGVRTLRFSSGDAAARAAVFPPDVQIGPWLERASGTERRLGVRLADGSAMSARLVVIASGSWTASTFRDLDLCGNCLSTGQTVATIQLTPGEAARYKDVPVVLDFHTNFYIFPPNDDNVVKLAFHGSGVAHYTTGDTDKQPVSTPRTISSHGEDGLRVPRSTVRRLRSSLRDVYPELAEKPFVSTRLCCDWTIGYYPSDSGLLLATSGSGHAYKFLPVIGRIVADAIEGTLDPAIAQKFAVDRKHTTLDLLRGTLKPVDLATEELCTPEDLIP